MGKQSKLLKQIRTLAFFWCHMAFTGRIKPLLLLVLNVALIGFNESTEAFQKYRFPRTRSPHNHQFFSTGHQLTIKQYMCMLVTQVFANMDVIKHRDFNCHFINHAHSMPAYSGISLNTAPPHTPQISPTPSHWPAHRPLLAPPPKC